MTPDAMSRKSIVVFAIGSRGDVQPSILLGLRLQARGHMVHMATEHRLRPLVEEFGLPWRCIEGDRVGVLFEDAAQEALRTGSLFSLVRLTRRWESRFDARAILESYGEAAAGADVIVGSALTLTGSLCIAQARGLPYAVLIPGPTWPTSEFPVWALQPPCRCLYRWSYEFLYRTLWRQERKATNEWRVKSLGQTPWPRGGRGSFDVISESQVPVLVAASELLCGPQRR